MVHFTQTEPPPQRTGPLPFTAVAPAALAALAEVFKPLASVTEAGVRPAELRLRLVHSTVQATLLLGPRDGRPAFATSRNLALGYEGADREDARVLALVQAVARRCDQPEVEATLWAVLRGETPCAAAGDALLEEVPDQGEFLLDACDGAADQLPRRLGPTHLLLRDAGRLRVFRLPGEAVLPGLLVAKNVSGHARRDTAEGSEPWGLAARCRNCAVRADCAGCFEPEPTTKTDVVWPPISAASLIVDGAALFDLAGRKHLARQLAALGPRATVHVVGRLPTAVLREPNAQMPAPRPAEPAAVAATLRGTRLRLVDYRLPGRHGADPWTLVYTTDPEASPLLAPTHVTLLANRKCVTVCRYCNLPLRLRENMPLQAVCAALEEAAVLGTQHVELFGGEVTLRKDLFVVLAVAQALGIAAYVTTTGVGVDDAMQRRLAAAGVQDLSISLDSADPNIHDYLKNREGMHAAAIATARGLLAHGAQQVGIDTVITRANFEGLPALLEQVADLGLHAATFFFCQPIAEIGQATDLLHTDEVLLLLEDILPRCHAIADARGLTLAVRPPVDRETGDRRLLAERIAAGTYSALHARGDRCHIAERLVCVQPEGDVRLCNQPIVQFAPEAVVGNVREASLAQVLASPRAEAFRKQAGQFEFCRYCTFVHEDG